MTAPANAASDVPSSEPSHLALLRSAFSAGRLADARVPRTGGAEELRAWARWIRWREHRRAR